MVRVRVRVRVRIRVRVRVRVTVVGADEQPDEVMAEADALDVSRLRAAPAEREGAHVQVPREDLCVCRRRGACIW